jgi:hypothetical protein
MLQALSDSDGVEGVARAVARRAAEREPELDVLERGQIRDETGLLCDQRDAAAA